VRREEIQRESERSKDQEDQERRERKEKKMGDKKTQLERNPEKTVKHELYPTHNEFFPVEHEW
jgi:hypothetical protein